MRKKIHELKNSITQNNQRFVTIKLIFFKLGNIFNVININQINWKRKIVTKNEFRKARIFTNTKTSIKFIVNINYVKQHRISTIELDKHIKIEFVDEFFDVNVTHAVKVKFMINEHKKQMWAFVIEISNFDIILDVL